MKRLIINLVLLVLIVLVVRTYILPTVLCWQDGGKWEYAQKVCSMGIVELPGGTQIPTLGEVVDGARERIDFSKLNELKLMIPDREETGATLVRTNDALSRFVATFSDGGALSGSAEALANLAVVDEESGLALVPFVVSYGGSGSFVYLGLFENASGTPIHRDSVLIGDRIALTKVTLDDEDGVLTAVVDFSDRRDNEPMSATPSQKVSLAVPISSFTFGAPVRSEPAVMGAQSYKDLIKVSAPEPGSTVSEPLEIRGEARGQWYFEGSFPVSVMDWDGRIIGEGYAAAVGEWMTTEYVPFTASISYALPSDVPYRRGAVILRKDNPSGLPENDDAFEIPVIFK